MSKIICDICGTVFPDNAEVCPICGYPRQENEKTATETQSVSVDTEQEAKTSKHTKGGHFSSKNVKKRLKEQAGDTAKSGGDGVWKAVAAILLVAVIGVGVYIGYRFWSGTGDPTGTTAEPSETTTEPSVTDTVNLACTGIELSDEYVMLTSEIPSWKLSITVEPADTVDELVFESSDESVATVDSDGRIHAVGSGSAVITVTCGDMSRECLVTVALAETEPSGETEETQETEEPTEEPTEEVTEPTEPSEEEGTLKLSHTDATLFSKGETFTINVTYNGASVSLTSLTWTSSDEDVATVKNGKVTATGSGNATITVEYKGVKETCIVRCSFKDEEPTEPTDTTEDNTNVAGQVINPDEEKVRDHNWVPNKTDVTIAVGESFTLRLTNDAGQIASVSWKIGDKTVASMDKFTVVGLKAGTTKLTVTINGTTYTCIVRVK